MIALENVDSPGYSPIERSLTSSYLQCLFAMKGDMLTISRCEEVDTFEGFYSAFDVASLYPLELFSPRTP